MKTPQQKGRNYEKQLDEGEISIPLSGAGLLKEDKKDSEYLIQVKQPLKINLSPSYLRLTGGQSSRLLMG